MSANSRATSEPHGKPAYRTRDFSARISVAAGAARGLVAVARYGACLERGGLVKCPALATGARKARGAAACLCGAHRPLEGHFCPPQLDRDQGSECCPLHAL